MSRVIASKRKEGVKQRGLSVERIYPLLEFNLAAAQCSPLPRRSSTMKSPATAPLSRLNKIPNK